MGKAGYHYRELRFVIQDDQTEVYARLEAWGDAPNLTTGWRYKAFPASMTVHDIIVETFGEDPTKFPINWPIKAPA